MKRLLLVLAVSVIAGAISFTAYFHNRQAALAHLDELSWLKEEFRLDDRQFAEVQRLRDAYVPVCTAHCAEYLQAQGALTAALKRNTAPGPELDQVVAALYQVQAKCQTGMLKHGYEMAAVMAPDQGARYLAMIKARVLAIVPADMGRDAL